LPFPDDRRLAGAARPAAARLPVPVTRFFGREEEIERIKALLCPPETRLVTLTGLGGAGKTRLALEVAGRLRERFPGPVYFVALADLTRAGGIPDAILDALGLPRFANVPPPVQVTNALHRQRSLLVLDNFEHLIEEGALYLRDLLAGVPSLTCLVTSRQRLGIAGEREFPVLPLPTPRQQPGPSTPQTTAQERLTPEQLAGFASVALFADRAPAARPDFEVTTGNGADVAALCRRLEGIPLAIELAAARAKALTPAQMLSQLDRRFDFLVSRQQDAVPRHRTLRAALDWSCDLLPAPVARFFGRLSVFRGGWTLEAAEAVGEVTAALALDYLEQLQDGSLVVAEEREGGMRFRMLETVRERAAEMLDDVEAGRWGAATPTIFCVWRRRPSRSFWARSRSVGWIGWKPSTTTCAPPWTFAGRTAGTGRPRPACAWRGRCGGSGPCAAISSRGASGWRRSCRGPFPWRRARPRGSTRRRGPGRSTGRGIWRTTRATMPRRVPCTRNALPCDTGLGTGQVSPWR
jgi:predicted ATPase